MIVYRARSIKRKRRTKAEIEALELALYGIVEDDHPMTDRQIFYQAEKHGIISKTERDYNNVIVRLLTRMRCKGAMPFAWIADNTRWMRKPTTYSSLQFALDLTTACYRRSVWDSQKVYIEVWLEKDALAGVVYEITEPWDVPLMVTRGYSSVSFAYSAAQAILAKNKPAHVYYFGDYDPSGLDISRNLETRLKEFAPGADIHFERVALNTEQVASMNLPTRPTKKSDSRSKNFRGNSIELDAVPPETLRAIVENCITRHINKREYDALQVAEKSERKVLEMFSVVNRRRAIARKSQVNPVMLAKISEILEAAEDNPQYASLVARLDSGENTDRVYRDFLRGRQRKIVKHKEGRL